LSQQNRNGAPAITSEQSADLDAAPHDPVNFCDLRGDGQKAQQRDYHEAQSGKCPIAASGDWTEGGENLLHSAIEPTLISNNPTNTSKLKADDVAIRINEGL
jgi:hypothetical protein